MIKEGHQKPPMTRRVGQIVGIADSGPLEDDPRDYWGLAASLAIRAIQDAGMTKHDIDGIVFSGAIKAPFVTAAAQLAEYLRIHPGWFSNVPFGGTPTSEHLMKAAQAINDGLAEVVLVVSVDNQIARFGKWNVVEEMAALSNDPEWEWPFGLMIPSNFAMMAHRHMYEYGTTSEQLATVAVTARRWAEFNASAARRDPITVEDVLTSPMISSPLHLLDISLVTDGGAALVLTTADRAKDTANVPISVLGYGESTESQHFLQMPDPIRLESLKRATVQALGMAGVARDDIDIVYPYDATTISVIIELEAMGFCAVGEGGAFVDVERNGPGGSLPMNTHGGLLSNSHPGPPGAMLQIIEAVRQLRGGAGERQVSGAELALCHGEGGFYSNQVNVLARGA